MYLLKRSFTLLIVILLFSHTHAFARDTKLMMPIKDALASSLAQKKLTGDVKFYFGKQKHPAVRAKKGTFTSNKKTNGFGKSDEAACQRAFLSALITFQNRAIREGGNAVININSYYKQNVVSSKSEYECHKGNVIAGVALQGTVVKLK